MESQVSAHDSDPFASVVGKVTESPPVQTSGEIIDRLPYDIELADAVT